MAGSNWMKSNQRGWWWIIGVLHCSLPDHRTSAKGIDMSLMYFTRDLLYDIKVF